MRKRLAFTAIAAIAASIAIPMVPATAGGGGACQVKRAFIDHNPRDSANAVVGMTRSCFTPTFLRVKPGTEVTFHNKDPYTHAVHGANGMWEAGDSIESGRQARHSFQDPGVYLYSCYRHPGMTGAIIVGDADINELASVTLVKGKSSDGPVASSSNEQTTDANKFVTLPAVPALGAFTLFLAVSFLAGRFSLRRIARRD